MLKLPEEVRSSYDTSSLRTVVHAAAPCPVEVKQQMIEWLGPVVHEYYASTEANGATYVGPEDWLAHPGTVGRPLLGTPRICDPDGQELPTGEVGHDLLRARRGAVHLPRRLGEDRVHATPGAPVVVDRRRPRLRRRGGLPVPHRPQGVHDHQRRREHLPAGDRGPVQPAPVGARHRGHRRARRRDGGAGGGVRPADRRPTRSDLRGRADGVRPGAHRALQGAARVHRHRRPAAHADGQAGQAEAARPLRLEGVVA